MFKKYAGVAGLALLATVYAADFVLAKGTGGGLRSLFLNGVDISSARSQDLKNVDVHINESGDVFIVAPHYQVNEEDTYVPLSKFVEGVNAPTHKPAQAIKSDSKIPSGSTPPRLGTLKGGEAAAPSEPSDDHASGGMVPKAGQPIAPEMLGDKGAAGKTAEPIKVRELPVPVLPEEANADEGK